MVPIETGLQVNEDGYISSLSGEDLSLPSIIITGDLCPTGQCEKLLSTGQTEKLFPGIIQKLQAADLVIANLECPLTHQKTPIVKSGPHLRADPACARGIRSAGFNVISLANNHIMDMGGEGLEDTLAACNAAGLRTVGVGENLTQAARPLWIDAKGVRVAIFTFAESEFSIATAHSPGAWPVDPINNYYQMKQAKQTADFILVLVHGGNEYYDLPNPNLVKLCRYFVDLGANAVVCNHVHVPGGIEIYEGVPIIYSTGNFLFEGKNVVEGWFKGYLIKLTIQPGVVTAAQLIPYWQSKDEVGVRLMNPGEQRDFYTHISDLSSIIVDPVALKEKWYLFVRSKRIQYLSSVLGLNKVERRLLRMGQWPFWRFKQSALAGLLNLFTCESHREVMISLLAGEIVPGKLVEASKSERKLDGNE